MNKITLRLDPDNNAPFEIEMNDAKNETHALMRIAKSRHCKALNLVFIDKGSQISKTVAAKTFTQLNLISYLKFSIAAEFVSAADCYLELDIYTGSWEEMILTEAEVSFSDSPFYISYKNDVIDFTIGAPEASNISVTQDDKGFSITTTIVEAAKQVAEIKNYIAANTEGAQVIGRLYGRIKGRVNGLDFHQRQEENRELYTENFNNTVIEGFHPINI